MTAANRAASSESYSVAVISPASVCPQDNGYSSRSYMPTAFVQSLDDMQVMTLRYRAPEIMLGVREYSAAVDMWSVGCIMAEMARGDTPFKGENEIDQLLKIFEMLGRPCPEEWPEVQQGENFQTCFPRWPAPPTLSHVRANPYLPPDARWCQQSESILLQLAPGLDEDGLDLLTKMLVYNPRKRISADEALQHPWFHDVQLPQDAQAEPGHR